MKKFFFSIVLLFSGVVAWGADSDSSGDDGYQMKPGPFECRGCFGRDQRIAHLLVGSGNRLIGHEERFNDLRLAHEKELRDQESALRKRLAQEYEEKLRQQSEKQEAGLRNEYKNVGVEVRKATALKYRKERRLLKAKHAEELAAAQKKNESEMATLAATLMRVVNGDSEEGEFDEPGIFHARSLRNAQEAVRGRELRLTMLRASLRRAQEREQQKQSEIEMLRALRPSVNPVFGVAALFGQAVPASASAQSSAFGEDGDGFGSDNDADKFLEDTD